MSLRIPELQYEFRIEEEEEEVSKKKEGRWRRCSFKDALSLGSARLFSMRFGTTSKYYLGLNPPAGYFEIKTPPGDSFFENCRDGKQVTIRMIRDGNTAAYYSSEIRK